MNLPKIRDDLSLLEGYHSPQVDVEIRLNTNESPIPPPIKLAEDLGQELLKVNWNRYPDRMASQLHRDIAKFHNVDSSMVLAANGSNEVLQSLLLTYGGFGRKASVFEPTYALHSHISALTGTEVIIGECSKDFTIEESTVNAVLQQGPDVLFLCSPNNPTGVVAEREFVESVIERCSSLGTLVIIDEAYGEFSDWSAVDLIREGSHIAVTKTFSKTWSMAGIRLGYVVAPSEIIENVRNVVLPYHLDSMKQIAGSLALQYIDDMHSRIDLLIEERERMARKLSDLPVRQWPSGANFILFRPSDEAKISGESLWEALLERSILVRNCSSWPRLEGCLRVTIGTTEENNSFLEHLEAILV